MVSVARSVRRRRHIEDWKALPWKDIERNVFRLQQRILRQAQDKHTKPNVVETTSKSTTCSDYCFAVGQPAAWR